MDHKEALARLLQGNEAYVKNAKGIGDISSGIRLRTAREGQAPFAVVITCADSRVIPEAVFQTGIGDLFVIREAGNVIGTNELGSIRYAAEHLGTRLILVLGHTGCGAVLAAIHHDPEDYIRALTDEILKAIGEERDPYRAVCLNVRAGIRLIRDTLGYGGEEDPRVLGAVYDLETGKVALLDEAD